LVWLEGLCKQPAKHPQCVLVERRRTGIYFHVEAPFGVDCFYRLEFGHAAARRYERFSGL
jgi:hypothetical protein